MSPGDLFFKAKKYSARYLAQIVAKTGDINPVTTDPLKTISIGLIADGHIFKDLIGPNRLVTGYSAIAPEE
jgi:hypothetical protein